MKFSQTEAMALIWFDVFNSFRCQPLLLFGVAILVIGCEPDQSFAKMTPGSSPGEPDIEFSLDIALQRASWGQSVGRCHLQAALRILQPREDDMAPFGEPTGTVIELPSDAMECAYTRLESSSEPVEVGSLEDNWAIAGDMIAADEIHLLSDHQNIILRAIELETGSVRYEWSECEEDIFPFGQVFDLHMPDAEGVLISGFTVESAFVVGPDIRLITPMPIDDQVVHFDDSDLDFEWMDLHEIPDIRGQTIDVDRMVWARNRRVDQHQPFEALGCRPGEEGMTIIAEDWMQLEPNYSADDASRIVGLQMDTVVTSPAFEAPWGKPISIRSTVSDGGDLVLVANE